MMFGRSLISNELNVCWDLFTRMFFERSRDRNVKGAPL